MSKCTGYVNLCFRDMYQTPSDKNPIRWVIVFKHSNPGNVSPPDIPTPTYTQKNFSANC